MPLRAFIITLALTLDIPLLHGQERPCPDGDSLRAEAMAVGGEGARRQSVAKGKHPWTAACEIQGMTGIIVAYNRVIRSYNHAGHINLKVIGRNFKDGWMWDNDAFSTNQLNHPYHGGLYFSAARANGLGFWESAPYLFAASLLFEYCCENEPPAINDQLATMFGGIAFGEVTHRLSNLLFDNRARGAGLLQLFTWKDYDEETMKATSSVYWNIQGDKGRATLLTLSPRLYAWLTPQCSA